MRISICIAVFILLAATAASAADDASINLIANPDNSSVTVAAKSKEKQDSKEKKDKKDKQDKKGGKGPGFLIDMLKDLLKSAGDEIEGSDMSEVSVDGDENEITRIDTVNININVGDIMLGNSKGGMQGGPGGRFGEFFNRFHNREMGPGPGMQTDRFHPRMPGMGAGMHQMDSGPDGHPGGPAMGGPHGGMMGLGQMPERMEIFGQIPPEVDADFIRFIMHVGELAWKHPEFRERLEQLVQRMDNAQQEHHPEHRER